MPVPNYAQRNLSGARGASLVEMLIVVALIGIVTAWAVLRIVEAQQSVRLSGVTQELTAYLDKARLDSIRRRATSLSQMAQVSINSPRSYSVTLDADGNGQLDPPRVFQFPAGSVAFNVAAYPTIVRFNWRGRVVDGSGEQISNPPAISLQDANGPGPAINLSAAGDTTTHGNINLSNVNVSGVNETANIRLRTQVPQ